MRFLLGQAISSGLNTYRTLEEMDRAREREGRLKESHDLEMRRAKPQAERLERDWQDDQDRRRRLTEAATGEKQGQAGPPDATAPDPVQLGGPESDQAGNETGRAVPFNPAGEAGFTPRTLDMLGGQDSAAPAAAPQAAPAPQAPTGSASYRAMIADRDYYLTKDPAKARKIEMDYLQGSWDMADITHKLQTQPALQTLADSKREVDELKASGEIKKLTKEAVEQKAVALTASYGMFRLGNRHAAIEMYNASNPLDPGTKAEDVGTITIRAGESGPDDKPLQADQQYFAFLDGPAGDPTSRPVKNREGKTAMWNLEDLKKAERIANTKEVTLNADQKRMRVYTDPVTGASTSTTIAEGVPKTQQAIVDRNAREADRNAKADRDHTDKMSKEAQEYVKTMANFSPLSRDREKLFGIASPIAERYARSGMNPREAGDKAMSEARDQIKREKLGAGAKGGSGGARTSGNSLQGIFDRYPQLAD